MTKNNIDIDGWNSVLTFMNSKEMHGHECIYGNFFYKGNLFIYSLNKNNLAKEGDYIFRGSIRAEDKSGKILKHRLNSESGKKLLDKYPDLKPDSQKLDVKRYINISSDDEEKIKEAIFDAAQDLYFNNVKEIEGNKISSARRDIITLSLAVTREFDRYVSVKHPHAGENYKKQIRSRLTRMAGKLPNKAMKQFLTKDIKTKDSPRDDIRELYNFWQFCIEERICDGRNPVVIPPVKKAGHTADQKSIDKIMYLNIDEQDDLYDYIEEHFSPAGIAAALMLGCRLTAEEIAELTVGDFYIRDKDDNYVIVILGDNSGTSATHNRSMPLLPRAAAIFLKAMPEYERYKGRRKIDNMPVVWDNANHTKNMSKNRIIQETKRLLERAKTSPKRMRDIYAYYPQFPSAQTLLFNSHDYVIDTVLNLADDDSGTAAFLKRESLTHNVTDDHYTTYTDVDAQKRIHDIMKTADKIRKIPEGKCIDEDYIDTERTVVFKPDNTRACETVKILVKVKSGESVRYSCPHGVTIHLEASEKHLEIN